VYASKLIFGGADAIASGFGVAATALSATMIGVGLLPIMVIPDAANALTISHGCIAGGVFSTGAVVETAGMLVAVRRPCMRRK
jgi:hypothetical protein